MPKKLLILCDSPMSSTGLARVARELSMGIYENLSDVFEVGTLGVGGYISRSLPFYQRQAEIDNYAVTNLPGIWKDFAGDENGILLTIWNASWLGWLSHPEIMVKGCKLRNFLEEGKIETWAYVPIDSTGPLGLLPESQLAIISGFDRVLAYTKWAANLIDDTARAYGANLRTDFIPHAADRSIFYPRSRAEARARFFQSTHIDCNKPLIDDLYLIGVVATNTERKDWALAFDVGEAMVRRGKKVGIWAHTNAMFNYWDLQTLHKQYGMQGRVFFSTADLSDEDLAWSMAACNVTLGIGRGEGWGLPISESMAMGIPCIAGRYSAPTEFVPRHCLVRPHAYYVEGIYGARRPVYLAEDWCDVILAAEGQPVKLGEQYYWDGELGVWKRWEKWLREGLGEQDQAVADVQQAG
jgi:glycosyltransferase involved in cell wall biosynthesis